MNDYEDAQLAALKGGLLVAAFIALGALLLTRNLPTERLREEDPNDRRPVSRG